jgi:hypothetical protein
MTVKAAYFMHGIIMGNATENIDGSVTFANPVQVIPQQNNMAFMPFTSMMEEDEITFRVEDTLWGKLYTPVIEMRNQYSKMFGTGIEIAPANILHL